MKQLSVILTGLALATISLPETAAAQVVHGIQVGPELPDASPPPAAVSSVQGFIDFDDDMSPCLFSFTVALTDEYDSLGVTFAGPGGFDGGAILDECSGFGITGYSPPNFFAFNTESDLSDGGIPEGPETLTFSPAIDYVQIAAGSVEGNTIMMECFDGVAMPLGSASITAAAALQPLRVIAPGIATCVLSFNGQSAAFDDLFYQSAFFLDGFESGDLAGWSSSVP